MHDMTWADVDRDPWYGREPEPVPSDPADRVQHWVENGHNLADKRFELGGEVIEARQRAADIRADIEALREELTDVEDAVANDERTINQIDAFVEEYGVAPGEDAGMLVHYVTPKDLDDYEYEMDRHGDALLDIIEGWEFDATQ